MKTLDKIPFSELPPIPKLIRDFIADELPGFLNNRFTWENMVNKMREKTSHYKVEQRRILVDVLKKQNDTTTLSEKQRLNLQLLEQETTVTVTTGHQLNLFTGPAFFVYKILQTIKTADEINAKNLGYKAVPIFWMATEDHDFEEINHFKTENDYYEIQEQSGGAVGRIEVMDNHFFDAFEEEFRGWPFGEELILLLKSAYAKGNTLSDSTRILVNSLFADYGVLVLDGDERELKCAMIPIFEDELKRQSLQHSSESTVDYLTQNYHKVQVNPRAINLFYLTDQRHRIEQVEEEYQIVDTEMKFTPNEIIEELNQFPERFSPNALMRPIYQETVLPNVMYVGGNAEIMYWFELKLYFEYLNLPYPILTPRNSMLFLTKKQATKAEKLHWEILDLFRTKEVLLKRYLVDQHPITHLLETNAEMLENHFDQLKKEASSTDKTFEDLVDAEKTRQLKSFARMKKRLLRAERIKQNEWLERVDKLWFSIHPKNTWQERVLNFSVFYSILGTSWLQTCYEEQDIETPQMVVVEF